VKHVRTILALLCAAFCSFPAFPQAAQLEKSLQDNPDDLAVRTRLLTLYEHAKDEPTRNARMGHLLWLIQHHSNSPLFRKEITRMLPEDFTGRDAERENFVSRWREQIQIHPDDVTVFENALANLNRIDYNVSVETLVALRRIEPTNPMWAFLLAGMYEGALTNRDFSARAAEDLARSSDLAVIGITGQDLYVIGKNGKAEGLAQYGESLLKRAQELDPMRTRWAPANAATSPVLTEADMWPYGKVPEMQAPSDAKRVSREAQAAKRIHGDVLVCTPTPKAPCPSVRTVIKLDAVIGKDGRVKTLHAPEGSVNLIPTAMNAVRQWTYQPTLVDGQPVEVVTQIDAVFAGTPRPAPLKSESPITDPVAINKPEPTYTEEAHKANFTGSVLVSFTVDQMGFARDVQVVRGAGYGLDERAVEAVRKWTFKPAMRDGKPIAVPATIEVQFKRR
jgi:TonB family protein